MTGGDPFADLERDLEALEGGEPGTPLTVRFRETRVDRGGAVVERADERVLEAERAGPDLILEETIVETEWEPEHEEDQHA